MIKRIVHSYTARKRPGICVCVCSARGMILFIAMQPRKEDAS